MGGAKRDGGRGVSSVTHADGRSCRNLLSGMTLLTAMALLTLVGASVGAAVVLAVTAAGPETRRPGGPVYDGGFAISCAALVVCLGLFGATVAWLAGYSAGIIRELGAAGLVLLVGATVSAVCLTSRWHVEPTIVDVLRRRATWRQYRRAHRRLAAAQRISRAVAFWGTAVLVVGWAATWDFAWDRVSSALEVLGLG